MWERQNVWDAKERKDFASFLSGLAVEEIDSKGFKTPLPASVSEGVRNKILDETVRDFCRRVSSKAEALWGSEAAEEARLGEQSMKLKLRQALEQTPPSIPENLGSIAVKPERRAIAVVTGTLFGMVLGSLVFGLFLGEGTAGILLGGLLFAWLTSRYIDNEKFEIWVNGACGFSLILCLLDVLSKFVSGIRKVSFSEKLFAGKESSFRAMVDKIVLLGIPWILKILIIKEFDRNTCRATLRYVCDNWLVTVEAVGMRLYDETLNLKKTESEKKRKDLEEALKQEREMALKREKNLNEFVSALFNANVADDQGRADLIDDLKTRARVMGYSSSVAEVSCSEQKKPETWREEMLESYATYGVVNIGDEVEIIEEAVLIDGIVSQRGRVRKKRIPHNG